MCTKPTKWNSLFLDRCLLDFTAGILRSAMLNILKVLRFDEIFY